MSGLPKIGMLYGGWNSEAEVSRASANFCATIARECGYDVIEIEFDRNLPIYLNENKIGIVFNALHGRVGEDGSVQGLLNILNIPYTHSGVTASALAMDKYLSCKLFESANIRTPPKILLDEGEYVMPSDYSGPYVIKPNNDGSSVGVEIILDGRLCPRKMWSLDTELIGEHYISGRELTVSVLNGKALCVTEIIANADFYDYKAKYEVGGSKHILPANIPEKCALKAKLWAEKAFNLIGCRGLARADFRWDEDKDKLYLLELNTQPGMTQTSLVPEQISFCNLSMHHLITLLIEAAQCD